MLLCTYIHDIVFCYMYKDAYIHVQVHVYIYKYVYSSIKVVVVYTIDMQ